MTADILRKPILKKAGGSDTVAVPELLSPAGDPDSARAAILCGADAIYLGLKEGSARAGAGNFTFEELGETCSFAHSFGVKVYVALNTLAFGEAELCRFADNAKKAASEGADGVIVQDTGLLSLLSEMRRKGQLPRFFRIHASTQAAFSNSGGVNTAISLGADRVILPRELTLGEIGHIKTSSCIELEVFVHGAMCMSFSGNCLLSSYIGGRSGNRGSCAQPCRMKYKFEEPCRQSYGSEGSAGFRDILSPDDLCALPFLDEVCRTGVASIKIEGRVKSPEYVALTTRIYREALDAISENRFGEFKERELDDALRCLRTMFTRSGGGPGYLKGNALRAHMTSFGSGRSGAMIGTADRIRRIPGIPASGNNKNTLDFFEFRLTSCTAGGSSGGSSISLSPGDGVTLIGSSGISSGGTVNRATGDGIITVCGTLDSALSGTAQPVTVFQTADAALLREIRNILTSGKPNVKLPVKFSFYAEAGQPAVLTAEAASGIKTASRTDTAVTEALTRPLSKDEIRAQLLKLGDTRFYAAEINIDVRGSIFMPVSVLNALRRQAVSELSKTLEAGVSHQHVLPEITLPASPEHQTIIKKHASQLKREGGIMNSRYYYRLSDFMSEDDDLLSGSKILYLPWETWESRGFEKNGSDSKIAERAINKAKKAGALAVASLPLLPFRADTSAFQKTLRFISETADGILLTNTGDFGVLEKAGIDLSGMLICTDISLNCANPRTVEELSRMGADVIALSPEYPDASIAGMVPENVMLELVYGPLPLMRMRHCVIGHGAVSCSRCNMQNRKFRIFDTAGSKYDIITLPDMNHFGTAAMRTENGQRFCENIILSADSFEPKASMQSDGPLLRPLPGLIRGKRVYTDIDADIESLTLPDNMIIRTQVLNGDDNDERKS